jgi:hypothetical protein
MDIILLGITIVSLVVALVMSVAAWRLMRDEKQRSAARVAALSVAASEPSLVNRPAGFAKTPAPSEALEQNEPAVRTVTRAPWTSPSTARPAAHVASVSMPAEFSTSPFDSMDSAPAKSVSLRTPAAPLAPPELLLHEREVVTHASGFLGATELPRDNGGRQKTLAFAAVMLFVVMSGGLVWMMSGPEGTSAAAVGPNSPLELVSLTHARQNDKLAVSGLVRNPVNGKRIEHLSAVVFLFDRMGTFVTSSRANVDFLNLGAGDESPFVVSLAAPATVSRYRVSFRTDDGIVPHIDRRSASPAPVEGEQAVNAAAK